MVYNSTGSKVLFWTYELWKTEGYCNGLIFAPFLICLRVQIGKLNLPKVQIAKRTLQDQRYNFFLMIFYVSQCDRHQIIFSHYYSKLKNENGLKYANYEIIIDLTRLLNALSNILIFKCNGQMKAVFQDIMDLIL